MNDLAGTPTPEDRLRSALRTLATDTAVEPSWDELVADLDRVVVIERPSPRRTLAVAAGVAAALVVLIGVIAAVRVGHDDTPAVDPARRYFSFAGGQTAGLRVGQFGAEQEAERLVRDDERATLFSLTGPDDPSAIGRGRNTTSITVNGTEVKVAFTDGDRGALWSLPDGQLRQIGMLADPAPAVLDAAQLAALTTALTDLVLPQQGCAGADPLCRPPDAVASLPADDPLPTLLRVLPALVGAATDGSAPPPPGFHREPLLRFTDQGSVSIPAAQLLFWRTDRSTVGTGDLERVLRLLLLDRKLAPPTVTRVGTHPAVAVASGNSATDAANNGLIAWSPAPGWIALIALVDNPAGVAPVDAAVAMAERVGEVDAVTWSALPTTKPGDAAVDATYLGDGKSPGGIAWTAWRVADSGVSCLSVGLTVDGPRRDCLPIETRSVVVHFIDPTLVVVLAPATADPLLVDRTDAAGTVTVDPGPPTRLREADYFAYVFEVPAGTTDVTAGFVDADGVRISPRITGVP